MMRWTVQRFAIGPAPSSPQNRRQDVRASNSEKMKDLSTRGEKLLCCCCFRVERKAIHGYQQLSLS